jgi:DNA-binding transcriptional LysR family regulator
MVGQFKRRFPGVMLSLLIADTEQIISGILDGALELGVVGAESRNKLILQEVLIEDQMRLIVPNGHPWSSKRKVAAAQLVKEPFESCRELKPSGFFSQSLLAKTASARLRSDTRTLLHQNRDSR